MSEKLFCGVFPMKDVDSEYIPRSFKSPDISWEGYRLGSFIEFGKVKEHAGIAIQERQVENQIVQTRFGTEITGKYSTIWVVDVNTYIHKVNVSLFDSVTILVPHSVHIDKYKCNIKKHPDYFKGENDIYVLDGEPVLLLRLENGLSSWSAITYQTRDGKTHQATLGSFKSIQRYFFCEEKYLKEIYGWKVVDFPCS